MEKFEWWMFRLVCYVSLINISMTLNEIVDILKEMK